MAKTVLNVKVDKETKEQARALANELGLPLSTIIHANLKEFIRTGKVVFSLEPEFKSRVWTQIQRSSKEAREGKNTSPAFTSAEEAIRWLRS